MYCSYDELLLKQKSFRASDGYSETESIQQLRIFALSYIAKHYKTKKFDASVPYVAMCYFDRIISHNDMPKIILTDPQQNDYLFVMCCLTLAWKMRMSTFKFHELMDEIEKFDTAVVLAMELDICKKFKWQMQSVTAIRFVEYFVPQVFYHRPVYQIIINSYADIGLTQYSASTVAAAAVLIGLSTCFPTECRGLKPGMFSFEFLTYIKVHKGELCNCTNKIEQLAKPRGPCAIIDVLPSGAAGPKEKIPVEHLLASLAQLEDGKEKERAKACAQQETVNPESEWRPGKRRKVGEMKIEEEAVDNKRENMDFKLQWPDTILLPTAAAQDD